MPSEVELERMVVRLVGDISGYEQSLKQAVDVSKSSAGGITNALKQQQSAMLRGQQVALSVETGAERYARKASELSSLLRQGAISQETHNRALKAAGKEAANAEDSYKRLAGAALQLVGAMGAKNWLARAFHEFAEAETVSLRLGAALEANGRDVEKLTKRYERFANEMQNATTISDEQAKSMLQQAENMGLTGDAAERAVRNTIAAQAAGLPRASLRLMAGLEQGNTQMLGFMLPGLRSIKDESKRAAKAQEMLAKMFGVARAEAKSSSGQIKQLKNAYSDLMEEFGAVVAEGIMPVVWVLKEAVKWFQSLSKETKQTIVVLAGVATGVLAIAAAIALAGFLFNTLFGGAGILLGILVTAGAAIALWVHHVGGVEDAWKQLLTVIIAVEYGVRNWGAVTTAATNAVVIAVLDLTKQVGLLGEAWEAITNLDFRMLPIVMVKAVGVAASAAARGLKKGFEGMAEDFEAFKKKRLEQMFGTKDDAKKHGAAMGEGLKGGLEEQVKEADAAIFGSAEARSRIQSFLDMVNRGRQASTVLRGLAGAAVPLAGAAGGAAVGFAAGRVAGVGDRFGRGPLAGGGQAAAEQTNKLLAMILDELRKDGEEPVVLQEAGLA